MLHTFILSISIWFLKKCHHHHHRHHYGRLVPQDQKNVEQVSSGPGWLR